jgi:hypothetical protein
MGPWRQGRSSREFWGWQYARHCRARLASLAEGAAEEGAAGAKLRISLPPVVQCCNITNTSISQGGRCGSSGVAILSHNVGNVVFNGRGVVHACVVSDSARDNCLAFLLSGTPGVFSVAMPGGRSAPRALSCGKHRPQAGCGSRSPDDSRSCVRKTDVVPGTPGYSSGGFSCRRNVKSSF